MKHLFAVRHPAFDCDYKTSKSGLQQMETLASEIKQILNGGSAYLFSSTAPWALNGARVLATQLGLSEPKGVPYLYSGEARQRIAIIGQVIQRD